MAIQSLKMLGSAGVSLLALVAAGHAAAQSANQSSLSQNPVAAAPEGTVTEVVVTATKRAENLQNVPVAVQALSGKQIQQMNVTSLADLTKVSPSFNFVDNSTPRTQATFIRGVGTYTTSDAIEPSVGYVVDGVALGRQGMAFIDPFNVSQVEVLSGPQGTLFGKNASAGVVNITTPEPSATPQFSGHASYGNRNEQQFGFSAAGPLAPGLTGRFSAYYNSREGDLYDVFLKKHVNDLNNYGFRAKLKYDSGPFDVSVNLDYNRSYADCCAWVTTSDGGSPTIISLLSAQGITAKDKNYTVAADFLPQSRSNNGGIGITAHYRFGNEELTSVTSARTWQTYEAADADQLPAGLLNISNRSRQAQFSEELRLSNVNASHLTHTFGLYYFHYTVSDTNISDFPASGNLLQLGHVNAVSESNLTYDNFAAFGEATYTFPDDATRLRLGTRVTAETVKAALARTDNVSSVPGLEDYRLSDSNATVGVSFVAALQHNFTRDLMAYVQVSRGFKGAAYDLAGPTDPTPTSLAAHRVQPEVAMNYELGLRSQWFDRRVTFNASLFYEDFSNYQATTYDATANAFRLENVGTLYSRGVEVAIDWRPVPALTIGGGVTYADTRYGSFKGGQCQYTFFTAGLCTAAGPGNYVIDLSGRSSFAAPKWSANINARYDWRHLAGPFNYFASVNYMYHSATVGEPSLDPVNYLKAYGLLDARIGLTTKNGRLEASIYGKNLTNQTYFYSHFFDPIFGGIGAGNGATAAFQGLRRSYGVELDVHF